MLPGRRAHANATNQTGVQPRRKLRIRMDWYFGWRRLFASIEGRKYRATATSRMGNRIRTRSSCCQPLIIEPSLSAGPVAVPWLQPSQSDYVQAGMGAGPRARPLMTGPSETVVRGCLNRRRARTPLRPVVKVGVPIPPSPSRGFPHVDACPRPGTEAFPMSGGLEVQTDAHCTNELSTSAQGSPNRIPTLSQRSPNTTPTNVSSPRWFLPVTTTGPRGNVA